MALDLTKFKSDLKNDLKTAAEANSKNDVTLDQALERLANVVADNVDAYIKAMTITIASGLVQVQGSPSAQTNVSPIVIENGIS